MQADEPETPAEDPQLSDADVAKWDAVEEGVELLRERHVELAINELLDVTLADPENEQAFLFLGHAYFEKKDSARALKAYVTALELAPGFLGALIGAGHALRMMGRHKEALQSGREALKIRAADPEAIHLLGLTYFTMGEYERSHALLESYINGPTEFETKLEVEGMIKICREHMPAREEPN